MTAVGDKKVGLKQSVSTGRFQGRFVYTPYDGVSTAPGYKRVLVNRISDGRFLGSVYHKLGTSWWYAEPKDASEYLPGRQSRREWAADALDAYSKQHEWCACGVSVASHDRPTRAAMRAWAGRDPARNNVAADAVTYQAAWHARIRGRHYDLTSCVEHARKFAGPVAEGHLVMVKPDLAPLTWVLVRPDRLDGSYELRHWIGEENTETYLYPGAEPTLGLIRDRYINRGYVEAYDWRK